MSEGVLEQPRVPETERRNSLSPEAGRMIAMTIIPDMLNPEKQADEENKQKIATAIKEVTTDRLPTKEIADLSQEERREQHATYEEWSDWVKNWFNQKDDPTKREIRATFTSLGIFIEGNIQREQIDKFYDDYLDMEGDYQQKYDKFVKDLIREFISATKTLDRSALDSRMEILKPLLGSFGQKDIIEVIDAHIKAHGFVAQNEEAKEEQKNDVVVAVTVPLTNEDSKTGFSKLAQKRSVRRPDEPESPQPEPAADEGESEQALLEKRNNELFAGIISGYGQERTADTLTQDDALELARKFKENPSQFLKTASEFIRAGMEDDGSPLEQRVKKVKMYVDILCDTQLDLDRISFPQNFNDVEHVIPEYVHEGLVDMGSDPEKDPSKRTGHKKIRIDKYSILKDERTNARNLLYQIYAQDPTITREEWEKRALSQISRFAYTRRTTINEEPDMANLAETEARRKAFITQILNQTVGITSRFVPSTADIQGNGTFIAHANNLVEISGQWYLLDVTEPEDVNSQPALFLKQVSQTDIDLNGGEYTWTIEQQNGTARTYKSGGMHYYTFSTARDVPRGPGQEERDDVAIQLTPELARTDPEKFKKLLLDNLDLYATLGKQAWDYAFSHGIVTAESLVLNPESLFSSNDSSTGIVLGTAEMSQTEANKIIFEDWRFGYTEQVAYHLLHELCHKLNDTVFNKDEQFRQLMDKTYVSRAETGEGFSVLGTKAHYERQGSQVQGKDDLVELVNMFLINPYSLDRFFDLLIEQQFAQKRNEFGLRTIDVETAQKIGTGIAKAVVEGLEMQAPEPDEEEDAA